MIRNVLVVLFSHFTCVFASDQVARHIPEKCESSSIFKVFTEQSDSIESVDDKKVYLKAANLSYINTGFVLSNDRSSIFLPRLSVDQNGYYLSCRSKDDDFKLKCPDPDCGFRWWYSDWGIFCPVCGTLGD